MLWALLNFSRFNKVGSGRIALQELLHATELFGGIDENAIAELVSIGRTDSVKKGEILFRRGDPGDRLALVLEGRFRVSNATAQGREVVLSFINVGELAGEISILDGVARSSDVTAMVPSNVFLLERSQFISVLQNNDEAYLHIVKVLCRKIRESAHILESNTSELLSRACAGLVRLGDLHGKQLDYGVLIDIAIPQKDLGAYLNMTRANANRQLSYLRDEGLVTIEDNKIILLDSDGLVDLAEMDDD